MGALAAPATARSIIPITVPLRTWPLAAWLPLGEIAASMLRPLFSADWPARSLGIWDVVTSTPGRSAFMAASKSFQESWPQA